MAESSFSLRRGRPMAARGLDGVRPGRRRRAIYKLFSRRDEVDLRVPVATALGLYAPAPTALASRPPASRYSPSPFHLPQPLRRQAKIRLTQGTEMCLLPPAPRAAGGRA
jgi:hypothetical protein